MTAKRLYRVVATYPDGRVKRSHVQTRRAAEHRRAVLLERWSVPTPGPTVTIDVSDPITFPADVLPEAPPQVETLPLDDTAWSDRPWVTLDPGGCGAGKHTACSRTAWDTGFDVPTSCPCCTAGHP